MTAQSLNDPKKQPLLVFLHVPKTAGSSLTNMLTDFYCERVLRVNLPSNEGDFQSLLKARGVGPEDFDVVAGHMPAGFAFTLSEHQLVLCVLRDPFARVLSDYRFVKARPDHPLHDRLASGAWSRLDFISCKWENNVQCRRLYPFMENKDGVYYQDIPPEQLLDGALKTLQQIDLLGITERFGESMARFSRTLGWPKAAKIREDNRTNASADDPLTDDERQALEEANTLDMILYKAALDRFEKEGDQ